MASLWKSAAFALLLGGSCVIAMSLNARLHKNVPAQMANDPRDGAGDEDIASRQKTSASTKAQPPANSSDDSVVQELAAKIAALERRIEALEESLSSPSMARKEDFRVALQEADRCFDAQLFAQAGSAYLQCLEADNEHPQARELWLKALGCFEAVNDPRAIWAQQQIIRLFPAEDPAPQLLYLADLQSRCEGNRLDAIASLEAAVRGTKCQQFKIEALMRWAQMAGGMHGKRFMIDRLKEARQVASTAGLDGEEERLSAQIASLEEGE